MSTFLNNVKLLLKRKVIDNDQALYMIFTDADIVQVLNAQKLLPLVKQGYIKDGKISKMLFSPLDPIDAVGTVSPIYTNELSKEVVKQICRYVCVKHKDKLRVPGDDEDPVKYTADTYLNKEHAIAYHYLIFLFLFPVSGTANKRWEKHFLATRYEGVTIRIRSKSTGKDFVKLAKKKDMGAFLLGAYRYIKSVTKTGKAYVTTIPKFLAMHDDWYLAALEDIENAKNIKDIFKEDISDTGTLNTVM